MNQSKMTRTQLIWDRWKRMPNKLRAILVIFISGPILGLIAAVALGDDPYTFLGLAYVCGIVTGLWFCVSSLLVFLPQQPHEKVGQND